MTSWDAFWDDRATMETEFQATGRSQMDVVGFLHTIVEVATALDLSKHDDVLDIGCGTGLMMLAVRPFVAAVHGIDISQGMIDRARRNLGDDGVDLVSRATITDTGRADRSADKVIAYSTLQYLSSEDEARDAIREVGRVLRPGGRALLAANPDPDRRAAYESVLRDGPATHDVQRAIDLLDDLLWLAPARALELAESEGMHARVLSISPRIRQHFYMYDLLLER